MSDQELTKRDIIAVFKRLRAIPSNKVCFDCGAKNPTWASVTYGVFICIDCSAVHRSLGVHLSFVRSTQLDTNWTWLQLRGMQVGGNANALLFFQQHNCTSTDTQQKYNSRAAQLYREKLTNLAASAMKLHGTKVHIETGHSDAPHSPEITDVDFFKEHSKAALFHQADDYDGLQNGSASLPKPIINSGISDSSGPNIEGVLSVSPTEAQKAQQIRKPTIGGRRTTNTTKGLGGRKGLGAQKVAADFNEIEKEAQRCDQLKAQITLQEKQVSKAEEERNIALARLAYQDLSVQQKKTEEKLRQTDPQKAAQLERLGMGFGGNRLGSSGVSHSAASEMKVIQQENPLRSGGGGSRSHDLEDDFEFVGFTSGPPKYGDSPFLSRSDERNVDKMLKDTWDEKIDRKGTFQETILPLERDENTGRSRKGISHSASSTPAGDEAQKKFGNAKSISSEQFFGGGRDFDYERRANLAKFEGSSSISSADYFGDGSQKRKEPAFNSPNLYDIKEGVKDGVSKVAGRLSSLANGVMSSLQDRYGY